MRSHTDGVAVFTSKRRSPRNPRCHFGHQPIVVMVRRLAAGAEWIRTFSPALDRQRFVGFVRVGADLPAHRSSEQLPASAYRSICRGGGPRPPLTARIRRHHHVSAIGGASASRNRRFESVPLLRRVIQIRSCRQISTVDKSKCFAPRLGRCRRFPQHRRAHHPCHPVLGRASRGRDTAARIDLQPTSGAGAKRRFYPLVGWRFARDLCEVA